MRVKLRSAVENGTIDADDLKILARLDRAIHGRGRVEIGVRVDLSIRTDNSPQIDPIARQLFDSMPPRQFAILIDLISGASVSQKQAAEALSTARLIA
ncbi:MAG: hypothetical protein IE922_01655 [Sphingomonadales bacterium]|nr:hypothetical protein [Sphingomonadales bacterium]